MTRRGWGALALLYMAGVFWLSSQPGTAVGLPSPWDKLAHAAEYAGLGFLLARATGAPATAWVLAALYGASDEVHQRFVPGREASPFDWLADAAGGFVGVWLGRRRGAD